MSSNTNATAAHATVDVVITVGPTTKLEVTPITTTVDCVCAKLTKNRINLRPSYNRSYKWTMKKFRSYITHVWTNRAMLQSLTLYKLSGDDTYESDDPYESECLDGQHRLAALKHFYESSPINECRSSDNMVYINASGKVGTGGEVPVALFYKETHETIAWQKRTGCYAQYLTKMPSHLCAFESIAVQLQTITSPLTISEKKRIFTDLQQGVKVTGDDLFRNLAIPLVEEIDAEVRPIYKETIIPRLATKPAQFAIHWLIRFYHLSCKHTENAENQANMIFKHMPDKALTECLKSGDPGQSEFAYDAVGYEKFKRDMQRLTTFCNECANLPSQPKLPPIVLHAVYTHFSMMDDAEYETNLPIIISWMDRGLSDLISEVQYRVNAELPNVGSINKVWEKTSNDLAFEQKKMVYCISRDILSKYTVKREVQPYPLLPKQKNIRKNLTKNIKKKVWDDCYGADTNIALCYVCDIKAIDRNDTSSFHNAHIIPHKDGGQATVDNIISICVSCNAEMKTQNLHAFQKTHYPNVYAKKNL